MNGLDYWDGLLIAGAVLIAVASLTRLMRARRNLLVSQVHQQMIAASQRRAAEEKRRKQKEAA
ncbi:MAG: hypothetical protein AAGF31_07080 [Planctomycetota bacterium]